MKIKHFFLTAAVLLLSTCTQEPLFWYINQEYPPIDPIIEGVPTEIVRAGDVLYVANRRSLWKYDLTGTHQWERVDNIPASYIKAIAATTTDLYVLDDDGTIHKFDGTVLTWNPAPTVYVSGAQQIYGAETKLFIGTGSAVYDYDAPSTSMTASTAFNTPGGLLRGTVKVGSDYYICTAKVSGDENTGIFKISGATVTKVYPSLSCSVSIKGIIATGSTVVAVNDEKYIIYQDGNTPDFSGSISTDVSFTGGMALWEHLGNKMILLGLQKGSGTFRYGYRELDLNAGDIINSGSFSVPGITTIGTITRTTSIDPGSRETSAIGKHPVTSLYVIPSPPGPNSDDPAGRPIIVASTQKDGVWSYRVRRGTPQWNGEDNETQ
jgi:hypothetical protein